MDGRTDGYNITDTAAAAAAAGQALLVGCARPGPSGFEGPARPVGIPRRRGDALGRRPTRTRRPGRPRPGVAPPPRLRLGGRAMRIHRQTTPGPVAPSVSPPRACLLGHGARVRRRDFGPAAAAPSEPRAHCLAPSGSAGPAPGPLTRIGRRPDRGRAGFGGRIRVRPGRRRGAMAPAANGPPRPRPAGRPRGAPSEAASQGPGPPAAAGGLGRTRPAAPC